MTSSTYISIKEASQLSGKSVQTIRRAVKSKKVQSRKRKTPQGYNYMISRESLIEAYSLRIANAERKQGGIKQSAEVTESEFATLKDIQKLQKDVDELLNKHEQSKESFSRFMKAFQERFVVMENQLKLLEEPGDKRWYQFWK